VTVTVLDTNLEPDADGTGGLETKLPEGLDEDQWLAGRARESRVVRLTQGGLDVDPPTSAATAGGPSADDHVLTVAKTASVQPAVLIGSGARLLVVVQDNSPRARANPAAGLTLRSIDGKVLVNLEEQSEKSSRLERPLWAVLSAELEPAPYLLRVATGDAGTMEQIVILTQGWQTQILLRRRSWGGAQRGRYASLPDATIAMARIHDGFHASDPDLRLTDLARLGLADEKQVLTQDDLEKLVYGKWGNPVLGLLGAHFLQRAGDAPDLLAEARGNLRRLLGDHPDVLALEAAAGEIRGPVEIPPMLVASWELLLRASVDIPGLIPPAALSGRIADRLFGSGAWLTWRPPRGQPRLSPGASSHQDLAGAARALSSTIRAQPDAVVKRRRKQLDPAATSALTLASQIAHGSADADLSDDTIVQQLGLPRAIAQDAFAAALNAFRSSK
jgi:hypothetical protein